MMTKFFWSASTVSPGTIAGHVPSLCTRKWFPFGSFTMILSLWSVLTVHAMSVFILSSSLFEVSYARF